MEYSIGEFANKLGVTKRTLHHYDKIGLFVPSIIKNEKHRYYTDEDIISFQKIVTLKYIGFSLEEIEKIINSDESVYDSMIYQRNKLEAKKKNLDGIIRSLDEMIDTLNFKDDIDWNKHNEIIQLINQEKEWIYESQGIVNLKYRKNIYDLYSPSNNNWKSWVFDKVDFTNVENILELGCGDGTFWVDNSSKIPENLNIVVSDISPEMLRNARNNLLKVDYNFNFKVIDMVNIPYPNNTFDLIYIEHALYLTIDFKSTLKEIKRVLKPGGKLYFTVISNKHLNELHKILNDFNNYKIAGSDKISKLCLENAKEQCLDYFDYVNHFKKYEILEVTNSKPLVNYVASCGSAQLKKMSILDKNRLEKYMDNIILKNKKIELTNLNGLFILEKRGI